MLGDAADMALNVVSRSFIIGVQMAAPFIVFGLVFYLGLGILGRLMPQIQVFFIAMPANIGIGFLLMALLLTMMMGWYIVHFENEISMLSGR
jgi:flagellar biosynthetic protein FliR